MNEVHLMILTMACLNYDLEITYVMDLVDKMMTI